jgi:hypothetical protein
VQAPHKAAPQPNLVPVRPTSSRITHSNGVSGSALTETVVPFRLKLIAMFNSPLSWFHCTFANDDSLDLLLLYWHCDHALFVCASFSQRFNTD